MEILEVEVEFLTDEVEEIEVDVNQLDDEITVVEEMVFINTNDIAGDTYFYKYQNLKTGSFLPLANDVPSHMLFGTITPDTIPPPGPCP